MPSLRRLLLCLSLGAAPLFVAAPSSAQKMTFSNSANPHPSRSVDFRESRISGSYDYKYGLNRKDCLADATLTFSMTGVGTSLAPSGYVMEAWAGANARDCTPTTERTGTSGLCWKVYDGSVGTGNWTTISATIRVQDLLSHVSGPGGITDYSAATSTACDEQTSVTINTVSVHFMWVKASEAGQGALSYDFKASTRGPAPPVLNTDPGVGEGLLKLSWTAASDANVFGYYIWLDPKPGSSADAATAESSSSALRLKDTDGSIVVEEGGTDAGTDAGATADDASDGSTTSAEDAADAQADADAGSTTTGGTCDSTKLVAGVTDLTDSPYANVAGRTTATYNLSGLTNDVRYTVAMASYDLLDNIGELGTPVCATPQEVTDFFDAYTSAGGTAGGGYCTLGPPRGGTAALLSLGLAGALALLIRRRRTR